MKYKVRKGHNHFIVYEKRRGIWYAIFHTKDEDRAHKYVQSCVENWQALNR